MVLSIDLIFLFLACSLWYNDSLRKRLTRKRANAQQDSSVAVYSWPNQRG